MPSVDVLYGVGALRLWDGDEDITELFSVVHDDGFFVHYGPVERITSWTIDNPNCSLVHRRAIPAATRGEIARVRRDGGTYLVRIPDSIRSTIA